MEDENKIKREERRRRQEEESLKQLQARMYSREKKGFLPWRRRRKTKVPKPLVSTDWQYDKQNSAEEQERITKNEYYLPKRRIKRAPWWFLLPSLLFLLVSIGATLWYINKSSNEVSVRGGIEVSVEGATNIKSGDVLELQMLVKNTNDVSLEMTDMIVTYPDGTVSPTDFATPLLQERIPLGLIKARSARRGSIRAVVYGKVGDVKKINIELQYRLKNSSAIYSKYIEYNTSVISDALEVSVDADSETSVGQESVIVAHVVSHASTLLSNVFLDMKMPPGLDLVAASPMPVDNTAANLSSDVRRFTLGRLRPGEEKTIQISVKARGQAGEVRLIKFNAGVGVSDNGLPLDTKKRSLTQLATTDITMNIYRPFIETELLSNGRSLGSAVAYSGTPLNIKLKWHNTLQVPVKDVAIKVLLTGTALNKSGILARQNGFYRSVDSLLIWDSKTNPDKLSIVQPGEKGEFDFTITPLTRAYLEKIRNPELGLSVHVTGTRINESNVPDKLKDENKYTVKVAPDTDFIAMSVFRDSPFGQKGPLPPKVEFETVYGIVWEVNNTSSDLTDAKVTASLPHYVRWVGLTTPTNEQIIYNETKHTLEWNLGDVKAGTGVNSPPRKVTFAIGFVPSTVQVGSIPSLVSEQVFTAIDKYTGVEITKHIDDVTTRLINDSGYRNIESIVVR